MRVKLLTVSLITILTITSCNNKKNVWIATAPAGSQYCNIDPSGITVIPNGRLINPIGKSYVIAPHPFGLTLSQDGSIAVTANSGTSPLSITIIKELDSLKPKIMQVPPGSGTDEGVLASVFMGLAISPDNQTVYVSGGQENKIFKFDPNTGNSKGHIDCSVMADDTAYIKGYIGDLIISKDGRRIYGVDQVNFRMIVIDTEKSKLLHSIPVGRYPFGIALSPDEKRAYVANVGMFEYSPIEGIDHQDLEKTAPALPPFAYLSEEQEKGIFTDTMKVPGLGNPNVPESFSVWTIDLSNSKKPTVIAKVKTGVLVGQMVEGIPAIGGASPNSVVATSQYVFVSNGNNDNISVINVETDTVEHTIHLDLDNRIDHLRGKIPFGLALSPDNKTLYVAESGINAVAVIDVPSLKIVGHIPTGWFPSKLKVSPDGRQLIVTNAKGYGSGRNAGRDFYVGPEGTYIGSLMKGTLQIIDIPSRSDLKDLTNQVVNNNFYFILSDDPSLGERTHNPVPLFPGEKESPIKYLVFISKENRTYDEVFGQIEKGKGEAGLARYGYNSSFSNRKGTDFIENADVMVNHLNLARKFAIADNFYVDSDVSADGHRWLVNTYPNEWVETNVPASYGGNRSFSKVEGTRGALGFRGASGAIYPEDYNEAGSLWDHLERNQVEFYNFGFSVMFEPSSYDVEYKNTGMRHLYNYPVPTPIFTRTSSTYPTYNMAIPDQYRVDMFMKEFNEKWSEPDQELPSLLTLIVPNDHGADDRPEQGYPFRESYMADNDLAVGRIVEFLSHTKYWKNMAIIITEDDAQNGVDHIDAHRSILMLISPWAKKDYVSHVHYSFGSIFKTFWNILGLPYLNQYDAGANDLGDFFTDTPDFTPYSALPVDKRIFDPQKALDPLDEEFDWKSLEESPGIDNIDDMLKDSKEQDRYRLENREKKKQTRK
ncbi:MAG: bifunctional YncE family protein/alkaline phosphatase family protein [Bacteroidales bacterium]|nr:bifunctional YncE family protein/alkaline phosphatase family protein [Bacteroidales bacterium]